MSHSHTGTTPVQPSQNPQGSEKGGELLQQQQQQQFVMLSVASLPVMPQFGQPPTQFGQAPQFFPQFFQMPYFPGQTGPGGQQMAPQVMWGMPMLVPQAPVQTASNSLMGEKALTVPQVVPMDVDDDAPAQRPQGRSEVAAPRRQRDRTPPPRKMWRRDQRQSPQRSTMMRGGAPCNTVGRRQDEPGTRTQARGQPRPRMPPQRASPSPRWASSPRRASYEEKGKAKEVGLPGLDAQAEAVWRRLIAVGQRVPPETEFLSDPVAQVVITGLLDEIVMLQQRNDNTIKTFATALKRRRASPEGHKEAKRLRASEQGEEQRAAGPETARRQKEPGEVTPTPSDLYDELVLVDKSLRGLSSSAHAPAAGEGHTRREDDLELMPIPFAAGVPKGADSSIMKFSAVVHFEAPLTAYESAVLAKDTRSNDDVEGRLPTMASLGLEEPSDESDYGGQAEDTPSEGETPANHRLRLARNKKKAARSEHEAARQKKVDRDREEQATGRIPEGLGVFADGMAIKRSNWFYGGALDSHFYYSRLTNTVFVSDEAIAAKIAEEDQGERYHHTLIELSKVVPRGFPMNPQQLRKLRALAQTHRKSMTVRIQAYYLMREFQRISRNHLPAIRDQTMALVCTPEYDHIMPPLDLSSQHMNLAVMPMPDGYLRWKDRSGRPFFTLAGFNSEGVQHTFNLDRLAQNLLYFSRPGMQNSVLGIAMDNAYHIHWRTMLGHALTRGLAPAGQARGCFARLAPHFEPTAAVNITDADVLRAMIANGIPPKWVDHAYTFGVVYLETHFFEANASIDHYRDIDDEQHRRLDWYGEPPAIPQWDGWRTPTSDDLICLHALIAREEAQGQFYMAKGLYYLIGMNPNRRHLWQRQAMHGPQPPQPMDPSSTALSSTASTLPLVQASTLLVNVDTEMRIDLASELERPPSV
ncbi:hypothetical protein C0992_005502 [Termitomyces sp. T32_za158]|nr:hypothetical protein C0992_005502 [Termitomyces sp. T32_za158]